MASITGGSDVRIAAIGDVVTISPYDWHSSDTPYPDNPKYPATHLRTVGARATGTVYEIIEIRRVAPRSRLPPGTRVRYSIRAVKLGDAAVVMSTLPVTARVITLSWNSRRKKRRDYT